MKLKLLVLTAFSLAGAALTAAPASAGWLFHRHSGVNRCSTVIVCRPYNAFTPACSGNMVCDGFCPFSCPGLPNGGHCSPALTNPMLGMCHDPVGLQAMQPMMMPHPAMGMPVQQFQAPMPMPMPQQTQMPMNYPVQAAGYQQGYYPQGYYPMYYPAYAPQVNYNPYQQAPAYWYGY